MTALVRRLAEAGTFVEVSEVVCERARATLDMHQTATALLTAQRHYAMYVDDLPSGATDDQRLDWVERSPIDPQMARMLEHHAAVGDDGDYARINEWCRRYGYTGARLHVRLLPLVEPTGLLGTIRCGAAARVSAGRRRDLDVLAAYASARLVRLGVTAAPAPAQQLTPAQRRVAELAATGLANAGIADELAISIDTVKKHLKATFGKLDVHSRAELASLLGRVAPREGFAAGVTHLGPLSVAVAA